MQPELVVIVESRGLTPAEHDYFLEAMQEIAVTFLQDLQDGAYARLLGTRQP